MALTLVTFTNISSTWTGKESRSVYGVIAINPAHVVSVKPHSDGSTLIHFGDGGANVTESYEEVVRRLRGDD